MTTAARPLRRDSTSGGAEPLAQKRRWQAITVATLLLLPAFWSLLAGLVAAASANGTAAPDPAAALALGLALIPFVFIGLAFMSGSMPLPGAVLRSMGLALLVGIPVSALAADAVTGIVAGIGAGGAIALRRDEGFGRARACAVLVATVYVFVLVRTVGPIALLPAPIFPLTGIGLADEFVLWRRAREETAAT